MKKIERKVVDWRKTGIRLMRLRTNDMRLRRYVCWSLKYDRGECSGECGTCEYDIDASISRAELAEVLCTSESVVFNWEKGKTPVGIEDLFMYSDITGIPLDEILVYEK